MASGLLPLLSVLLAAGLTAALAILAWQLTPGLDFFVRRDISVAIAAVGLVAAAAIYTMTCIHALRRVARWQEGEDLARALGALVALTLTAVLVALPVILAVLLPQHPAP